MLVLPESVDGWSRRSHRYRPEIRGASVEGVETSWGLFALPGNPYVMAVMVNYSDDTAGQGALRQIADAAYEYFRRVTRSSAFGVRLPLLLADSVKKPSASQK